MASEGLGKSGRDGVARPPLMLVSRDRSFSHAAQGLLEGWAFEAHVEEDEAAAAGWFRAEPVRLAIIDFDLPDHMAERLCRSLRDSERPGYVFLIGYGSGTTKEHTLRALEAGADAYVQKPLHPDELRLRIDNACRLLARDEALAQGLGPDLPPGMVGRQAFDRFFDVLFAQYQRSEGTGVLMFVEMTNRSDIYRRYGFAAAYGAELEVARRINYLHRASDFIARVDDGSFCLVLNNTTSLQSHIVALRLADALADTAIKVGDAKLEPRLSISMADFPAQARCSQDLVDAAPRTVVATLGPKG